MSSDKKTGEGVVGSPPMPTLAPPMPPFTLAPPVLHFQARTGSRYGLRSWGQELRSRHCNGPATASIRNPVPPHHAGHSAW